jgi:hypothetical protein
MRGNINSGHTWTHNLAVSCTSRTTSTDASALVLFVTNDMNHTRCQCCWCVHPLSSRFLAGSNNHNYRQPEPGKRLLVFYPLPNLDPFVLRNVFIRLGG